MRGLDAAGQPTGDDAGSGRAEQEQARLAAGEAADLVEQLARVAGLQLVGEVVDHARGLLEQVTRGAGGPGAGAVGQAAQLLGERGEALPGLLLLGDGLLADLAAALVEQVLGLALGLVDDLLGLVGRGGRDLATGLHGGLLDVLRLVLGDVGGRRGAGRVLVHGGGGRERGIDGVSHRSSSAVVRGREGAPWPPRHPARPAPWA